ncbi:MAG TPA: hypothetical protein VN888_15155, partial [Mycobacterium sp.]|nr:hypothetical protein [Mycobacterium sp.]
YSTGTNDRLDSGGCDLHADSFVFSVSFRAVTQCWGRTALDWHSPAAATANVTASRNAMFGLPTLRKWRDIILHRSMVRTTSLTLVSLGATSESSPYRALRRLRVVT